MGTFVRTAGAKRQYLDVESMPCLIITLLAGVPSFQQLPQCYPQWAKAKVVTAAYCLVALFSTSIDLLMHSAVFARTLLRASIAKYKHALKLMI